MKGMREQFTATATELLENNSRLALLSADIGLDRFESSGVLERHPDRIINVGIREQLMIGMAAGFAVEGLRPMAHSYVPFLIERAFEQIKLDLCHQDLGAILISVGASHDWATGGYTHFGPGDVALLSTLPEWEILIPGHGDEVDALLRHAERGEGRIYIRLSEATNACAHPQGLHQWTIVRDVAQPSLTVLAVGPMLDAVLEATASLSARVLYSTTVRPLDERALQELCKTQDIVIVEPYLEGTSTAAVSAALCNLPRRIAAIGTMPAELRRYGTRQDHDRAHGLGAAGMRQRIKEFLKA
jgi:transketolase